MSCLPRDWTLKPLGSVATLQRGFDLPVQARCEGTVPILAANGPVGAHSIHKVAGPGVVTGRSGTLGKVHLVKEDFWPLNTALWVKDFHGNDPAWIYRLLTWMRLEKYTRGAGVPTLNRNLVHVVDVPLPPLDEQKRIAAILDAVDALRANRREALAQLDALVQSTFLDMFGDPVTNPMGWEKTKLGSIGVVQGGLQVTSKRRSLPVRRPYLRVANVYRGFLNLDEIKTINLTKAEERRTMLEREDILIVEGHGNKEEIGRCARWDGSIATCVHQNHLIRLRCDRSKVNAVFTENYINSEGGRKNLARTSRTTSGLNTISVSKVKATPIVLPPLELQHRFAAGVRSIEQQKASQRAHLAELDRLFASLQHRAFNGEL